MLLSPLLKFGPRARSTSWGIGLCTMFIVASFSVVDGLEVSMNSLEDNFSVDYNLLFDPSEPSLAYFAEESLGDFADRAAFGIYIEAPADGQDAQYPIIALNDPRGILPEAYSVSGNQVLAGRDLDVSGSLSLMGTEVTVVGEFSSTMFSPAWLLGSVGLLQDMTDSSGLWNFAIAGRLAQSEITELQSMGFAVVGMVGIIQFLDSGMNEIKTNALWLLVPASFVIAVLAYSFLGMETADRAHDIGILKTLGAGRRRIFSYLLLNAFLICAWGSLQGLALGIVLSYGVSTFASTIFTAAFTVNVSESILALAILTTVGTGCIGALTPAVKMTLTSPVGDLNEVRTRY